MEGRITRQGGGGGGGVRTTMGRGHKSDIIAGLGRDEPWNRVGINW